MSAPNATPSHPAQAPHADDARLRWASGTAHDLPTTRTADGPGRSTGSRASSEWDSDFTSSDDEAALAKSKTAKDSPKAKSKYFPRKTNSTSVPDMVSIDNDNMKAHAKVSKRDGRLKIRIKDFAEEGYMSRILGAGISRHLGHSDNPDAHERKRREEVDAALKRNAENVDSVPRPKLNIVVMVIGSRGDIQPFIKVGKILQNDYGHRVRIATHPAFKKFVEEDCGLEFFSVGGDPSELMAFMVKNPGLIPSMKTVREGEVGRRRDQMFEMFQGFWRACINATDDESDPQNKKMRKHILSSVGASDSHLQCNPNIPSSPTPSLRTLQALPTSIVPNA